MNYYNEFDPKAAAWIRELIADGLIPDGDVDERSIVDVRPDDVRGYTQCHFFAGIGGWVRALQLAGVSPETRLWSGSCPCPPFSCAGKKKSCPQCQSRLLLPHPFQTGIFACCECGHEWFADARHLWPEFYRLIKECRPPVVYGEQVGGADGEIWLAGVRACLEIEGYGVGASDLPAASVGAPHKRQRIFWCAVADPQRDGGRANEPGRGQEGRAPDGRDCEAGRLAESPSGGLGADGSAPGCAGHAEQREQDGGVGNAIEPGLEGHAGNGDNGHEPGRNGADEAGSTAAASAHSRLGDPTSNDRERPTGQGAVSVQAQGAGAPSGPDIASASGFWSDAIWWQCRDGKQRRIPMGSESVFQRLVDGLPEGMDPVWLASHGFPLAPKIEGRVGLLRGYGNAINPYVAAAFIQSAVEAITEMESL